MAILKDLIVHGSSRFLNKIYAEELETSAFEAESAIIKKLTAKDATMENATVIGLLDVQGQLHTNTWTNSNIATIDGCFYITPTLSSDSGKISFTSNTAASLTGSYSAVTSLYIGGSSSGSTVQWTKDSNILLTGEVEVNGQWLPLGTLLGTLSANATTSSIGLTGLTDNRHNPSSIITDIRNAVSSTALDYRNLKISLYQRKDGSDSKPIGIYMTAMGANGKTFIDIYGGVNATTTAGSSGGFADPNLRIGNLSGLGAVEGTTPQGWGIYTTNGYFKGVIVSSAGKIGNFTINSALYSNNHSAWNSNVSGIYINNDGISGGAGGKWWLWNDGSAKIGEMTLSAAGTLTVPAANVSGELTAATINGSKITANSITAGQIAASAITADELAANAVTSAKIKAGEVKADNIAANAVTAGKISVDNLSAIAADLGTITAGVIKHDTVGGTNGIWLSADTDTSSNITVGNSTARKDWRLLVNNKFGVTTAGALYCSDAHISGEITATSGTIGGASITGGKLIVPAANISGELSADIMKANSITAINSLTTGKINATRLDVGSITVGSLKDGSSYSTTSQVNTAIGDAVNNIEVGGKNLLKRIPINSPDETTEEYKYYDIPLTEQLSEGQVYVIQLWNVFITNDAKTASELGINVHYRTNTTELGSWIGTDYFTNGMANYLTLTFIPTEEQLTTEGETGQDAFIRLYNSLPSVSGANESIVIERWKLEKGNKGTDWSVSPEETENNINTISDDLNQYKNNTDNALNNIDSELETYGNYINIDTTSSQPTMTLGAENSPVQAVLTNTALEFTYNNGEEKDVVAYIGADTNTGTGRLFATSVAVEGEGEMIVGNWAWYQRSNGNFCLKWTGNT